MALFNQSTKAVSAVVQEIADAVGASADPEMQVRAYRSLSAGLQHFNNRANWDFALVESDPISVIGPFEVTGVSASAGQSSALAPAGHGFLIDDVLVFPGVQPGTRVSTTAAGSFTFNSTIGSGIGTGVQVVTAVGQRDVYTLPSAWKAPYSIRMHGAQSTLRPIRRRLYDRSITSEFTTSTPVAYDIFIIGGKGKIRLLPPPAQPDTMQLRYYRRMEVPSASGATGLLDVPQDYEPYLIAWSKWHFIMDKGEGRSEQGQTWISFATDGIKTMLADQTRIPDEDLKFTPGHYTYDPAHGPNSTRGNNWDY